MTGRQQTAPGSKRCDANQCFSQEGGEAKKNRGKRQMCKNSPLRGWNPWWSGLRVCLVTRLCPVPHLGIPNGYQQEKGAPLNSPPKMIEKQKGGFIRQREGLT